MTFEDFFQAVYLAIYDFLGWLWRRRPSLFFVALVVLIGLFLLLLNPSLLPVTVLDPIWLALLMNWRIDRCITDEASVHVNDILFRNIKAFRNQSHLIGV